MPQRKTKTAKRWTSPKYALGFCFERGGRVYLRVADVRRSTKIPWHDTNKKQAVALLEKFVESYLNPSSGAKEIQVRVPETLYECITEFRAAVLSHSSPDVIKKLRSATKFYFPENLPLQHEILVQHLILRNGEPLAQATRRKYLMNVRRFFDFAVKRGYLEKNPVELVGIPQEPRKTENLVLRPEQVAALVAWFRSRGTENCEEYANLFAWQALTGMRISETLAMKWEDVDATKVRIVGKGGIYREFPLGVFPEAREILNAMKKYSFEGGFVWRWRRSQLPQRRFRVAIEALGFDQRFVVHTLRASAGWYYENVLGFDLTVVAELLGHSPLMNVKRYRRKRTAEELQSMVRRTTTAQAASSLE